MNWKQLYVDAIGHQGAMRDVARRSMLAAQNAQNAHRLELATRVKADRAVPIYILCAMLDTLGVEVPHECESSGNVITALH